MLTNDMLLIKKVIPNTFLFAVIVGPVGYALQFLLAWLLNKLSERVQLLYVMAIYVPSIAGGVLISVVCVLQRGQAGISEQFPDEAGFYQEPHRMDPGRQLSDVCHDHCHFMGEHGRGLPLPVLRDAECGRPDL